MRILVAYATRKGTTAEVAAEVGWALGSAGGCVADVRPIAGLDALAGYDAAVVGSAIRGSKWLPEAVDFVMKHEEHLTEMQVAYFAVCLTMREDTEGARAELSACLDPVRDVVAPVDVGLFAGALDYSQFTFPMGLMMRTIKAPEGDFRDWTAIREWGAGLGRALVSPAPAAVQA